MPSLSTEILSQGKKAITPVIIVALLALLFFGAFYFYSNYFSPKARALRQLDSIVLQLKNLPKDIQEKVDQTAWEIRQEVILEGSDDPQIWGLFDIRRALEEGDFVLAKERMGKALFLRLTGPVGANREMEALIRWTSKEIDEYDPERMFIASDFASYTMAKDRDQLAIKFLKLYYSL